MPLIIFLHSEKSIKIFVYFLYQSNKINEKKGGRGEKMWTRQGGLDKEIRLGRTTGSGR